MARRGRFRRLVAASTAVIIGLFGTCPASLPSIKKYVAVREVMAEPVMKTAKEVKPEEAAKNAANVLKKLLVEKDPSAYAQFNSLWMRWSADDKFWGSFVREYNSIIKGDARAGKYDAIFRQIKGKVRPNELADAVNYFVSFAQKGFPSPATLKEKYGDDFFYLNMLDGAYNALTKLASTGEKGYYDEFIRVWKAAVPEYGKFDDESKEFIKSLQKALDTQAKGFGDAAKELARTKKQRYLDFSKFADAVLGAKQDLMKQNTSAVSWMKTKYGDYLLSYIASKMDAEAKAAKSAVDNLEKFVKDPKDSKSRFIFLRLWAENKSAAFYIDFHISAAKSSSISILLSDYEKKSGVNNESAAKALCDTIESVYDNMRSSKPDPSGMASRYGSAFVSAVRSGKLGVVPQKTYTQKEIQEELDQAGKKLDSLEAYFKELNMNRVTEVRAELDSWSDTLYLYRQRLAGKNLSFSEANALNLKVPPKKYVELVIKAADMDARDIDRVYNGTKSYTYTITSGWISRMETILTRMESTKTIAALDWVYENRLKEKLGDDAAIRSNVYKLKGTVSFVSSILSSLSNPTLSKSQLSSLTSSLSESTLFPSDFKDTLSTLIGSATTNMQTQTLTADSVDYWKKQIALINKTIDKLPQQFRERVALQFYSKWHEEYSGLKGYKSLGAALSGILESTDSFSRQVTSVLENQSIYYTKISYIGQEQTTTKTDLNSNGEIYKGFRTLSPETQYEIYRQFSSLFGPSPSSWNEGAWQRFAAVVDGVADIPGSHAALLLKRIGPKLLKYEASSVALILGVISGYSAVFYPAGHYRELGAYYESLPPKLDKIFTDIFATKDEIKESYKDVRIIKPTEQSQFAQLLIPAARIIVQVPKHVYESWVATGTLLELRQASRITSGAATTPDILRTESRFFNEKAIEGRLALPTPFITPIIALSKLYLLAPNYIPEVGEWYSLLGTQQASAAWERVQLGDNVEKTWQALSTTSLALTGEGKTATGTYTLKRGTGTESTDEGTLTLRNLRYVEEKVSNAFLVDLEEFRAGSKSRQAATWKGLESKVLTRVEAIKKKEAAPASEEAKAIAAFMASVSAITISEKTERGKATGIYQAALLSDRGTLAKFETTSADMRSAEFRSSLAKAILGLKQEDFTSLRKQRMDNLLDNGVHKLQRLSKEGKAPFENTEASELLDKKIKALENDAVSRLLSSLGSVYLETVEGKKNLYSAEIRIGTTALFQFVTSTKDTSSAQFRQAFWNKLTSQNALYVRGLLKGKGHEDFAYALETLNNMPEERQNELFSSMGDNISARLKLIDIPTYSGERKKMTQKEIAERLVERVTLKEAEPNKYTVFAGNPKDGIIIGKLEAKSPEELTKKFGELIYSLEPDTVRSIIAGKSKWYEKAGRATKTVALKAAKYAFMLEPNSAIDGDFYIKRVDDKVTRLTTSVNSIAPGGADSAVYFDRTYEGTTGATTASSIGSRLRYTIANMKDADYYTSLNNFNSDISSGTSVTDSSAASAFMTKLGLSSSEQKALTDKLSLTELRDLLTTAKSDYSANKSLSEWESLKTLSSRLVEDFYSYNAYIFKRFENGSFYLVDVKTLTQKQVEDTYSTIKPESELAYRLYARAHPVMGKHEAELEGSMIFAGQETAFQGAGAAYQGHKWGAFGLYEHTRGGRAAAGIGGFNPEKRSYWVGRMYLSDVKAEDVTLASGKSEAKRGYYGQFTMLKAEKYRVDAFAGYQQRFEAGGVFDYLADWGYLGGGCLSIEDKSGGRFHIMDRNLVNGIVLSGLYANGQWGAAGGARYLFLRRTFGLEMKLGGIAQQDKSKGGFLNLTLRPDGSTFFNSYSALGAYVTGERELKIAGIELGGPKLEADAYWSILGGGAGELKLHLPRLDITAGGAGNIEGITSWAGWGGARLTLDRHTLFAVTSLSKEISEKAEEVESKEFMVGYKYRFSPTDYEYGKSHYLIGAFSGLFQDVGSEWGKQYDLQLGYFGNSFYDRWYATAGYQRWENSEKIRDALTIYGVYDTKLPVWIFRDLTFSGSLAFGRDLTKDPEWEKAFFQFMLTLKGTL